MTTFPVFLYSFPKELEEVVVALLGASGVLGLQHLEAPSPEIGLIEAYFPEGESPTFPLPPTVKLVHRRSVVDQDWLESYRRQAQPLNIGDRFRIDPREPEPPGEASGPPPNGRFLIHVPARQAFGTGSHESTRLALELLERSQVSGKRVLDVGAGSGILSFAALALGASRVVGFDIDLPSAFLARQYCRLNAWAPDYFAGDLKALAVGPHFDLALVNILPERILDQIPLLEACLAERCEVILSGILESRGEEVLSAYAPLGFEIQEQRQEGDWVAFRCRR
ncbi:MAG: 50S ribosomal protein L11 methyltransferase [Deltaproteobacteria bacterium]|nr:50S ribosomal protein L11 methyltransferase [Deltaproteobacteria bacterium]